jgi:hypothetical protein
MKDETALKTSSFCISPTIKCTSSKLCDKKETKKETKKERKKKRK